MEKQKEFEFSCLCLSWAKVVGRHLKIIHQNHFCVGVTHFGAHLILINRILIYF